MGRFVLATLVLSVLITGCTGEIDTSELSTEIGDIVEGIENIGDMIPDNVSAMIPEDIGGMLPDNLSEIQEILNGTSETLENITEEIISGAEESPCTTSGTSLVYLKGIYEAESGAYKAKFEVFKDNSTETKYIVSGTTEGVNSITIQVNEILVSSTGGGEVNAYIFGENHTCVYSG
ncbi:MAG: hypothetical protein QF775_01275 [archaeon]|nr:hypothetical protein [Euryarchaeota archaeon]MDP6704097.1 hypothetical protein [archaeon]|tara:strand:- start:63465 stop:63995 length:531 start_codon:yes stop_codon:yes gene_type:complete